MELGHLLTRSGLTYPEVSSKVCPNSFCQLGNSVSLPWVIDYEAFYLHVVSSFYLVNILRKYGNVPKERILAFIVSIHWKLHGQNCENYRRIIILHYIHNVYAKLITQCKLCFIGPRMDLGKGGHIRIVPP